MEKIRRVFAWITIVVIIGLIIGMVICAVTGSKLFFAMLYLMIVVPLVLWVFMWFTRLVSGVDDTYKEDIKSDADDSVINENEDIKQRRI